jgi:hypothetical protein
MKQEVRDGDREIKKERMQKEIHGETRDREANECYAFQLRNSKLMFSQKKT